MAPIDDSNPGRSYYFGTLPQTLPSTAPRLRGWAVDAAAVRDRWLGRAGPEHDRRLRRQRHAATHRIGPRRALYVEGGTAVLRSGWDRDAMAVVVLGEHDTASEFGRDRTGAGRAAAVARASRRRLVPCSHVRPTPRARSGLPHVHDARTGEPAAGPQHGVGRRERAQGSARRVDQLAEQSRRPPTHRRSVDPFRCARHRRRRPCNGRHTLRDHADHARPQRAGALGPVRRRAR